MNYLDKTGLSYFLTKLKSIFVGTSDSRLSDSRTPKSHASTATTYGVGTTTSYGHVKTINNLTTSSHTNGNALSAYQGYLLNQNKVDKVSGKGLSANDFTDTLKTKLDGIEAGAQVNTVSPTDISISKGQATIASGTTITNGYEVTLPVYYVVGNNSLFLMAGSEVMQLATSSFNGHYKEVGTSGARSNKIQFYRTSAEGSWTLDEDLILTCVVRGVEQ